MALLRSGYAFAALLLCSISFGQRTESEVLAAASRVYDIVSRDPDGNVFFPVPPGRPEVRLIPGSHGPEFEVEWAIAHHVDFDAQTLEFRSYHDATYLADPDPAVYDGPRLSIEEIRLLADYYLREFGYSDTYTLEAIEPPNREYRQPRYSVRFSVRRQGLRVAFVTASMWFDALSGRLRAFVRHGKVPPPTVLPNVITLERGSALCIQAFINRYPTAYLQVRPPELVWWVPQRPNNPINYSAQDESDRLAGRPIPVFTMMAISHPHISIAAEPFVDARTGRVIGWDGGPGSFGGGSKAKPLTWDWGSGPIEVLTHKGWRRVEHSDVVTAKASRLPKFDQSVTLRRGRLMVTASFDASHGLLRLPNKAVGRPSTELLRLIRRIR